VLTSDLHHESHTRLLDQPIVAAHEQADIDAIVVPTIRSAGHLKSAMAAARDLGCKLVVLYSHHRKSYAGDAARMGTHHDVDVLAADLTEHPLPVDFTTTRLLAGTRFGHTFDINVKRNVGLLLARAAKWSRIVLLDDDITDFRTDDLRRAAYLLSRYHAVGLDIGGCPDNSVVCHVNRLTGGHQDTFIGGGALAVAPLRTDAFFPSVYNEDWLFLLHSVEKRLVTTLGKAVQGEYDPFASPRRAKLEEFGDCLAEGLFYLLDQGKKAQDADAGFWGDFIEKRRAFIRSLQAKVPSAAFDDDFKARMADSLKAALDSQKFLSAQRYVAYLRAFEEDRALWRHQLEAFEALGTADAALEALGLLVHRSRQPVSSTEPNPTAKQQLPVRPKQRLTKWSLTQARIGFQAAEALNRVGEVFGSVASRWGRRSRSAPVLGPASHSSPELSTVSHSSG
jgi:hypothetical protein